MPRSYKEVEILLINLEQAMCEVNLWSSSAPAKSALTSTVPFAYDKMPFEQWLQFIFIPKMRGLIQNQQALPTQLALSPMAELQWGENHCVKVKRIISQIDLIFTDN
ncbi:YqcC family protein [Paraglaciecola aestuariivivens]